MDIQLIEKLDRKRYLAVLLEAIGFLELMLVIIIWYIVDRNSTDNIFIISCCAGLVLLLWGGIWYGTIKRRIDRNIHVRQALNNEMHLSYKYKSHRSAFWITMIVILAFTFIPNKIPAKVIGEIVILAGFATLKFSWLIYNRR